MSSQSLTSRINSNPSEESGRRMESRLDRIRKELESAMENYRQNVFTAIENKAELLKSDDAPGTASSIFGLGY